MKLDTKKLRMFETGKNIKSKHQEILPNSFSFQMPSSLLS